MVTMRFEIGLAVCFAILVLVVNLAGIKLNPTQLDHLRGGIVAREGFGVGW